MRRRDQGRKYSDGTEKLQLLAQCWSCIITPLSAQIIHSKHIWIQIRVWYAYWFKYEWIFQYTRIKINNKNMIQINVCIKSCTNIQIFVTFWQRMILIQISEYIRIKKRYQQISKYICLKIDTNECLNMNWNKNLNISVTLWSKFGRRGVLIIREVEFVIWNFKHHSVVFEPNSTSPQKDVCTKSENCKIFLHNIFHQQSLHRAMHPSDAVITLFHPLPTFDHIWTNGDLITFAYIWSHLLGRRFAHLCLHLIKDRNMFPSGFVDDNYDLE